jgi:two-component system, cell cycle sensor histidine kinase and response regulator CckA
MKHSLRTKVSLVITAIIIVINGASTYLFTVTYSRSKEKGRIQRGTALSYALSEAAEEGLLKEDLNLIKKASSLVHADDVTLVQVYSNIWDIVDSYPFNLLKNPPHPEALEHFRNTSTPFHVELGDGYDFYTPIEFKAFEETPAITIGYVRLLLSTDTIKQEIRRAVIVNILVSAAITLIAILSINHLIGRLIVRPVMALHRSVADFKNGLLVREPTPSPLAADEIKDLTHEFNVLFRTLRDREERLVESDRRIRSLFERVEHCIFRLDRNGAIIEANSRFRSLFGDAGALCEILTGDQSSPDCLGKAAEENVLHLDNKAVARNGAELTVSLSLYPEKDAMGAVVGFDGYIIDMTEKKRLEERLVRAQKMEAIGTLAGGMAHDYNNLLTAILGYSSMLLKKLQAHEPFFKPVSIIHEAAQRGAELGRKILAITRNDQRELRPVDLNDIVRTSLELLQRSLPKNMEIVTRLADGLPLTKADPSQMQQVIINLAVNARDAMPGGGKLTIETSLRGASGPAPDARQGQMIRLSVADNGAGIDAETQTRIFDPFFTTKDVGKGTGLGLYIVHSIIHNHGGHINLSSEPARGTQFTIYLPVIAPDAGTTILPEVTEVTGSGTILVIDDEPHVREMCRDMLGALGYTVLLAENGPAGLQFYRKSHREIDLVILDMIMPKMSGPAVFAALKDIDPAVKVLLYSGYSNSSLAGIDELLMRGVAGFIQKPFSAQDIGIAIKKALS